LLNQVLDEHSGWWDKYPGNYEHWRFSDGFNIGWEDAYAVFASAPARRNIPIAEIGYKGPWAKIRAAQHAQAKGSNSLWEFGMCTRSRGATAGLKRTFLEHGFKQGVDAARADFAQTYC
jgi:glucan 1,3-beta-glucosidase